MILNRAAAALLLAALAALPAYAEEPRDAATALAEGTQEEPCAAETESAKRIQCLRKRHDSSSLYLLGMAFRTGGGVKADQDQALRLLRKASRKGSAAASLELALIYRGPRKDGKDADDLALGYAETSCEQQSPDGCTLYGSMLMETSPSENAEEAAEAFTMASSRGSGEAFLHLGRMTLLGLAGDGKMTAEELFLAAERRGITEASLRLGEIYRDGLTVPQNYQLAAEEFRKAAEKGNDEAMNDLAVLYTYGLGVEQSYSKARELYEKAVGLGSADAMNNLAMLYQYGFGVRKSYPMAARLLESAARQGSAQAFYNLALMRIRGQNYDRDEDQAFDLMSEAAKRNHPEAASNLGWMYWNGVGTTVNRRLGCRWWDNAVIAGNDTARENLTRLCRDVDLSSSAKGKAPENKREASGSPRASRKGRAGESPLRRESVRIRTLRPRAPRRPGGWRCRPQAPSP